MSDEEQTPASASSEYDQSKIQVLEGLEAVDGSLASIGQFKGRLGTKIGLAHVFSYG